LRLLIIVGIVGIISLLVYVRLRPYVRMARQMFGAARDVRRVVRQGPVSAASRTGGASDKLVRCEACGTWIPSTRAVKIGSSNAFFCSHACLERTAEGSKQKAAS
jgi:hypothetical protein